MSATVASTSEGRAKPALLSMRLDKWLWAARFFKTRTYAVEAINGGKIHLNGQRSKPGKDVRIGNILRIHKESLEWEVEILGLVTQRRPASEAVLLYRESEESKLRREQVIIAQRLSKDVCGGTRPTKRDRRQIHKFTVE